MQALKLPVTLCLLLCLAVACSFHRRQIVEIEGDNTLNLETYLGSIQPRYSLTYEQDYKIELKKLPQGFRYDVIADPKGISVSAKLIGDTVVYTLKPTAVGFTSVVFTVYDGRNRNAAIADAGIIVEFAGNYSLEERQHMIFKTFQEVEFSYKDENVSIDRVGDCEESLIHDCISKYRLTAKKKQPTEITFEDDITIYRFSINM